MIVEIISIFFTLLVLVLLTFIISHYKINKEILRLIIISFILIFNSAQIIIPKNIPIFKKFINQIDSSYSHLRETVKDDISRSTIRNVKFENPNVVLPFKTYTVKDGLIGNRIRALMQDAKGFMWIGTTDGLSIYDGSKFKNYSETNGSRIGSIVTIYESKFETGTVWVSQSSEEILRIKDEHITIYKCENTDKKNFAFCFYEDSKGVLWCGTRYGLYFLKGNKFSKVNTNLEFESVKNIYRHSDNSIILVSDFDCYYLIQKIIQ